MQVQYENGEYGEPEPLGYDELGEALHSERVRKVIVFPMYDEQGKPSPEMRRAWRRWNRTKRR